MVSGRRRIVALNILSLTYLGNVHWFSKLCFSECVIDVGEHYVKQSYRNRCRILAAGGVETLTVNIEKPDNWNKLAAKDVRIDYSKRWQHLHRQSIVSAYGNAPFFEHYWPELGPFYDKNYTFLYDLNRELLETSLRLLKSPVVPVFSERYVERDEGDDLRDIISPKPRLSRPDPHFSAQPYWQVFSAPGQFAPDLSVLDLLFCEGPQALDVIRRSVK